MHERGTPFDFREHSHAAVSSYLGVRTFYEELAAVGRRIIEEALNHRKIKVHSVQARAKDPTSFGVKAALPCDDNPLTPKYERPLEQITDLAGVRVITYFPSTLTDIDDLLGQEFRIVERSNKGAELIQEDRFGYQSIHYLVKLGRQRGGLSEYQRFSDSILEIQVRTILQHAWAEIEHDIQYKSSLVIPAEIRRRFMALAGLFEMADREFQAIQDADERLTAEARSRVEAGELNNVEITPDALKAFLDQRLGNDGRISDYSYDWTARLLKRLGFRTLEQVDKCIRNYDDDKLSRLAAGSRQGQTTRFEFMLLAGMGDVFLQRHSYANERWWTDRCRVALESMRSGGVAIRSYDPSSESANSNQASNDRASVAPGECVPDAPIES